MRSTYMKLSTLANLIRVPGQKLFGIFAIMFLASAQAATSEVKDDFLDLLNAENQVFSASRYAQTIAESPADVSLITRDDINRFGYRSIGEALAAQPGFYNAASQWPAVGLRGVAIPGDFSSRILYMVNGMPLYEPFYGGFFVEYLDINSIERIEVVRGIGSSLYGSGAVMGIVNLITQKGYKTPVSMAALEAGSNNTYKVYGSDARVSQNGIDSFVSVSGTSSRGRDVRLPEYNTISSSNDAMENLRLFGRLADKDAWLQFVFVDAAKNDPLGSFGTVLNTGKLLLRERFSSIETGINKELNSGAIVTGRAYFFDVSERGDYPYQNGTPIIINVTDISSRTVGTELRYDQYLGQHHRVLTGMEIKRVQGQYEVGNQPGTTRAGVVGARGNPDYDQYSVFAQDEWQLDDKNKRKLTMGARYDYYSGFSEAVTGRLSPRIAYVEDFGNGNTGKLLYGEAYRAPTMYESKFTDLIPNVQATLWENPNLAPEITRTLEAIWEQQSRKDFNWKLGTYYVRMHNSPRLVEVPTYNGTNCPAGNTCNQYQNSNDTTQTLGIEGSVKAKYENDLNVYASATLQRARLSNGSEPASSPHYLLKGGVSHPLPWMRWNGALEANLVGETQGRIKVDGARTAAAPRYLLLNATISSNELADGWRLSLRVNNLLNETAYTIASRELLPVERVPSDTRTFSLLASKTF